MLSKIKKYIDSVMAGASGRISRMSKAVAALVICYFSLVVVLVLTYFGVWSYLIMNDRAGMDDLLQLITLLTGGSAVAFLSFIAGCLVDLNGNGVPDILEKKDTEGIEEENKEDGGLS